MRCSVQRDTNDFRGIRTKNGHWNYKSAIFLGVTDLLFSSGLRICYFLQGPDQELHSVILYQSNVIKEANASTGWLLSRKIY